MKVALLTDIHFGARNDSLVFHLFFKKFYEECFFPYLDEHDIKHVILGGDTFDRRKYINFLTLELCKQYFFNQIDKRGINLIMNIGNHDVFYKNTNYVNSPQLLFPNSSYEFVVDQPRLFQLQSLELLVVPWITDDNYDVCMDQIRTTQAQVMYGHLELAGFEMTKGSIMEHGMSSDPFDKFDIVLTGHYHHRSNRKNVFYLGSPYEMTWGDADEPHGFHILDTETRELEFIENPFRIFHRIWYNDTEAATPGDAVKNIKYSDYKDCYVKLIVSGKSNVSWFEGVITSLEEAGVADLQIVEDRLGLHLDSAEELIDETEGTPAVIKKYIQSIDGLSVNRQELEKTILEIYNEAIWASENE